MGEKVIVYFLTCACVDFMSGPHGEGVRLHALLLGLHAKSCIRILREILWQIFLHTPPRHFPCCAAVLPRLPQCKSLKLKALHGKMKQAARAATLAAFADAASGI